MTCRSLLGTLPRGLIGGTIVLWGKGRQCYEARPKRPGLRAARVQGHTTAWKRPPVAAPLRLLAAPDAGR